MPRFDEEGKMKGRPSTVGKLHHFFGQRYGDDAEEGRGLDLFMSHSGRVGNYRQHQANKNVAHHVRAKDAFSNAILAQSLGIDHVQDMPTPEELRGAGIRLKKLLQTKGRIAPIKATGFAEQIVIGAIKHNGGLAIDPRGVQCGPVCYGGLSSMVF